MLKAGIIFFGEKVLIEAKFLYNKMSIGDKGVTLKKGMIIQIKRTSLVDASYNGKPYQIVWSIIEDVMR
jgi:hypothetical protein